MSNWVYVNGKAWETERSPELWNTDTHQSYHMVGFQEIVFLNKEAFTSVCFYAIRVSFSKGMASKMDHYSASKESLLTESDLFFPSIELVKSPEYDNNKDPCATRFMPGNSNQSVKFSLLKTEEAVKNAIDYIKAIEPSWYARHGEKLLADLSLQNRPYVKKLLAMLKPVTEKTNARGETVRYLETMYEIHERLDHAMILINNISGIYSNEKDALLKLISEIEQQVIQFKNRVPDSRADGLISELHTLRSKTLGERQTQKRTHEEHQVGGTQTTYLPGYDTANSLDSLRKRIDTLEAKLEQVTVELKTEKEKAAVFMDLILEQTEKFNQKTQSANIK